MVYVQADTGNNGGDITFNMLSDSTVDVYSNLATDVSKITFIWPTKSAPQDYKWTSSINNATCFNAQMGMVKSAVINKGGTVTMIGQNNETWNVIDQGASGLIHM